MDFKKETARDLISFGSLIFFIIILARASIGPYWDFFYQMTLALGILFIFSFLFKKSDMYAARSLIILVFTSIFYKDSGFTAFVILIWALIIISLIYLDVKIKEIVQGIVLGAFSSAVAYFIISMI
ncbi:MAG: hypothetical protein KKE23_00645 [Nanoarchaeota archaeon]|nr:hypothetical protein [Nanoarchaeota archaeon]